jgi:hypothetical protein
MAKTILKRIEEGLIILNDNPGIQNLIDIKNDPPKNDNAKYCSSC